MFNAPAVVIGLLAAMVALHLGRQALSAPADDWLVLVLAFIPVRYSALMTDLPGGVLSAWASPLTHMFVHGDATHLVLNGASLLAFGSILARRIGGWRFIAFTAWSGLCGALLFYAFNPDLPAPMIGASGAIAGHMAAALLLMFSAADTAPNGYAGELIRRAPHRIALMSLKQALLDRRVQSVTGVWLAMNLLAYFGLGGLAPSGGIAWEAHLGGYFAGLFTLGWFDMGPRTRRT
jgi:membrane associated rhomboid family serine protease